ncbi:MAG: hypothetical protein R3F62_25335 [Planctomycetota bacterium]
MAAILTTFVVAGGVGTILVVYHVAIRRTWRKEHDEPVAIPGPETTDEVIEETEDEYAGTHRR